MNARTGRRTPCILVGLTGVRGASMDHRALGRPSGFHVPAAGSVDSETEEVTAPGLRSVPLAGDRIAIRMACLTLRERT